MLESMRDYIQLFFYDKDLKRIVFDGFKLKESDEKELRKFVTNITYPVLEEIGKCLTKGTECIDVELLGTVLSIVYKDMKAVQDLLSKGIRNFNILEGA